MIYKITEGPRRAARDEVWVETSTTRASHVACMGCLLEVIQACRANGRHTSKALCTL